MDSDRQRVEAAVDALVAWNDDHPGASLEDVLGRRYDLGLAWVENAPDEGGLGVDAALQEDVERLLAGKVPEPRYQLRAQWGMFGPAFMRFASKDQRARWLRPLFTGEDRWCVLLSEPNAGSDLASVTTNATPLDDTWLVNGQKVWTSQAHSSTRGLLLARHDPAVRGHAGLSAFAVDMTAPGLEVRPLRQMSGDAEFNEVFLTDLVVPDAHRVGSVGDGWAIVMFTLAGERRVIAAEGAARDSDPINELMQVWDGLPEPDAVARQRLAALFVESEAVRMLGAHLASRPQLAAGGTTAKVAYTAYLQHAFELATDLLGADGTLYPDDYEFVVHELMTLEGLDPRRNFLSSRGRTIGGGTTQVLLNVIGERVLGLPREPRPKE